MKYYDIAFEINSELFGGDEFADDEDVERVRKIIEQRIGAGQHETIVSVPDDIKDFIRSITLDLQQHRSKSEEDLDKLFQNCYKMYVKYKVEKAH